MKGAEPNCQGLIVFLRPGAALPRASAQTILKELTAVLLSREEPDRLGGLTKWKATRK